MGTMKSLFLALMMAGNILASTPAETPPQPRETAPAREYMNLNETFKYLGISKDTFYRHVAPNVSRYKIGSMYRYKKSELDRFMERSKDG